MTGDNVLDAALTVATQSRDRRGRGAASTSVEYTREWKRWGEYCRPPAVDGRRERWHDPMDVSPELLATYASHLVVSEGLAVGTARKAVAAIKSRLRSSGAAVPDAVPALVVLRDLDDSARAAGAPPKHTDPMSLDNFLRLLGTCDPLTVHGRRDAAILHLFWAGLRLAQVAAVDLAGLSHADAGDELPALVLTVEGLDPLVLRHWRSSTDVHDPRVCPVEALDKWAATLRAHRAVGGPYLRGVNQHTGAIHGLDLAGGGTPAGRLSPGAIAAVVVRCVLAAGLNPEARDARPLALKLGGAAARLAAGAPGLGAFAAGTWSPTSASVRRLLEDFTPAGAGAVALTWPDRATQDPPARADGNDDGEGAGR